MVNDIMTPRLQVTDAPSVHTSRSDDKDLVEEAERDTTPTKRDRVRNLARNTRRKAKDICKVDDKEAPSSVTDDQKHVMDEISSDLAFNPSSILNQSPPKLSNGERSTIKSGLKSAINTIAHPRQSIQGKATRLAAAKISKAQRPYLSAEEDRNFLTAHNDLERAASSRSSVSARTSPGSSADTSGDENAARQKVEDLEK